MLVMVIGAGPAGLRAASALERLNIPLVLVDPMPAGGALNHAYDYENSRTRERESSLCLRERLLAPWGETGPPLLVDRVVSAAWKDLERMWVVKMTRGERTVSWLLVATGASQHPSANAAMASSPFPLIVEDKPLRWGADRRDLPWQTIGDARAGATWTIDEAIFSANAAVAKVANAVSPHAKHHFFGIS